MEMTNEMRKKLDKLLDQKFGMVHDDLLSPISIGVLYTIVYDKKLITRAKFVVALTRLKKEGVVYEPFDGHIQIAY